MSPEDRCLNDPVFRHLVDTIYVGIVGKKFTPTEVRDAAMLAMLKYESLHARHLWVVPEPPR